MEREGIVETEVDEDGVTQVRLTGTHLRDEDSVRKLLGR